MLFGSHRVTICVFARAICTLSESQKKHPVRLRLRLFYLLEKTLKPIRHSSCATSLSAYYQLRVLAACVLVRLVVEGDHERHQDQLSNLFRDLGPIPPPEDCDDRAMWVAALINPLPALGVALEIRPAVLSAQSTTTRLQVPSSQTLQVAVHDHALSLGAILSV